MRAPKTSKISILIPNETSATIFPFPKSKNSISITAMDNEERKNVEQIFESIHRLYDVDINDNHEIIKYLLKYPELISLLSPMSEQLRKIFGSEAQVILEMYFDPEIDYHYLIFCLRLNDYSTDFMKQIELIHEPFDEQMAKTAGWLLITTDFNYPQR